MMKAGHAPNRSLKGGRGALVSKLAGLGVAVALLAGCASMGGANPEAAVKARANARWAALIKGDQNAAYQYNTPGFRATVPPEKFVERRGKDVRVLEGEAVKVTCSTADKCDVQIRLAATAAAMFRQNFPKQVVTYIDETWLLEGGQWWIFEKL
ncbi:hypothetical protein G7047_19490 [Diaphorobacter sp. HDW4A]|uniref:hypothetical protein n=1 Tax=Diaphorobacter sp. HDW4A TaxID=2714924 RepID=UPI0014091F9F|nr:hypothetical protein [Diaphorobacter sp. HDW4A]QIL81859.1 hypothetical protein G7047_19490 [Diaphorobacter sp. HDW4A]